MRKNFGAKPLTYPQPVFIIATYDENGIPNAMNAAWGGVSEEREITIGVDAEHKTAKNIMKSSEVEKYDRKTGRGDTPHNSTAEPPDSQRHPVHGDQEGAHPRRVGARPCRQ